VRDSTGATREIPAQLVLIAAGFVGPELDQLSADTELARTARDTIQVTSDWRCAAAVGGLSAVFACGDAVRGQSLIVWAIAEGRAAAAAVDAHLQHRESRLPAPLMPYEQFWQ
jgi:glutamate synthase (NADPH/NADH) small chain